MRNRAIVLTLVLALCLALLAGCGAVKPVEKAKDVVDAGKDVVEAVKDAIPTADTSDIISMDEAKAIALERAGLKDGDVTFTKTELDVNITFSEYEIDFTDGENKYECDIDADTGEVRSFDKEAKK